MKTIHRNIFLGALAISSVLCGVLFLTQQFPKNFSFASTIGRNNDNYVDSTFWNDLTTSTDYTGDIIEAFFGTGGDPLTKYTENWDNYNDTTCTGMSVEVLDDGNVYNTTFFTGNTIYIISGTVSFLNTSTLGGCIGFVGNNGSGSIKTTFIGFNGSNQKHILFDGIHFSPDLINSDSIPIFINDVTPPQDTENFTFNNLTFNDFTTSVSVDNTNNIYLNNVEIEDINRVQFNSSAYGLKFSNVSNVFITNFTGLGIQDTSTSSGNNGTWSKISIQSGINIFISGSYFGNDSMQIPNDVVSTQINQLRMSSITSGYVGNIVSSGIQISGYNTAQSEIGINSIYIEDIPSAGISKDITVENIRSSHVDVQLTGDFSDASGRVNVRLLSLRSLDGFTIRNIYLDNMYGYLNILPTTEKPLEVGILGLSLGSVINGTVENINIENISGDVKGASTTNTIAGMGLSIGDSILFSGISINSISGNTDCIITPLGFCNNFVFGYSDSQGTNIITENVKIHGLFATGLGGAGYVSANGSGNITSGVKITDIPNNIAAIGFLNTNYRFTNSAIEPFLGKDSIYDNVNSSLSGPVSFGYFDVFSSNTLLKDNRFINIDNKAVKLMGSNGNRVEDNFFEGNAIGGSIEGGVGNTFLNNQLSGGSGFGIVMQGGSDHIVRYNDIFGYNSPGNFGGILLDGGTTNFLVSQNQIHDNTAGLLVGKGNTGDAFSGIVERNFLQYNGDGILYSLPNTSGNLVINLNDISLNGNGITIEPGIQGKTILSNNEIYNNDGNGIALFESAPNSAGFVEINSNLIFNNTVGIKGYDNTRPYSSRFGVNNSAIFNNTNGIDLNTLSSDSAINNSIIYNNGTGFALGNNPGGAIMIFHKSRIFHNTNGLVFSPNAGIGHEYYATLDVFDNTTNFIGTNGNDAVLSPSGVRFPLPGVLTTTGITTCNSMVVPITTGGQRLLTYPNCLESGKISSFTRNPTQEIHYIFFKDVPIQNMTITTNNFSYITTGTNYYAGMFIGDTLGSWRILTNPDIVFPFLPVGGHPVDNGSFYGTNGGFDVVYDSNRTIQFNRSNPNLYSLGTGDITSTFIEDDTINATNITLTPGNGLKLFLTRHPNAIKPSSLSIPVPNVSFSSLLNFIMSPTPYTVSNFYGMIYYLDYPDANFNLSKTDNGATSIESGETITYTINFNFLGPDILPNGVTLIDTLGLGLDYVSSTITPTIQGIGGGQRSGQRFFSGPINPGFSTSIVLTAVANTSLVNYQNTLTVTGEFNCLTGCTFTENTPGGNGNFIQGTKSASPASVLKGGFTTFTITYVNSGSSTLTGITISDPIPAGLQFSGALPTGAFSNPSVYFWTGPTSLAPGETGNVQITMKILPSVVGGVPITNVALLCGNDGLFGERCSYVTGSILPLGICVDGIKDVTEACDDGNNNNSDSCTNSCTINTVTPIGCTGDCGPGNPGYCGNGVINEVNGVQEECDDANPLSVAPGQTCVKCKLQGKVVETQFNSAPIVNPMGKGCMYDDYNFKNQIYFPDTIDHRAFPFIQIGLQNCLFRGKYGERNFYPGDNITRAEMLKIIVRIWGIDNNLKVVKEEDTNLDEVPYTDIPRDAWYGQYFVIGKKLGLTDEFASYVDGSSLNLWSEGNYVYPKLEITRFQAIKAIMQTYWLLNPKTSLGGETEFADIKKSNPYYTYVLGAEKLGFIGGYKRNNKIYFDGDRLITRAAFSKIIVKPFANQLSLSSNLSILNSKIYKDLIVAFKKSKKNRVQYIQDTIQSLQSQNENYFKNTINLDKQNFIETLKYLLYQDNTLVQMEKSKRS